MLGFLVGMRHAVDSDHVAAVASLATSSRSAHHTVLQGAVWGLGHTVTLFLCGSAVLILDTVIPERLALGLEFAVGIMLVCLGIDVLRRLRVEHAKFRINRFSGSKLHFHTSDSGEGSELCSNERQPVRQFPLRALAVGLMHGMAGSAALILLTLQQVQSLGEGFAYIALFGVGSIAGMAALSVLIAIPLRYSARSLAGLYSALQGIIGMATIAIGGGLVVEIALAQGLLSY